MHSVRAAYLLHGMFASDSAALAPEIIANSTVLAEREITRLTTAVFKATQSGNQEAKAAVELVPGVTSNIGVETAATYRSQFVVPENASITNG